MAQKTKKRIPPDNTGKKYRVRTTARQRQFVALVLEGRSAHAAALEAGYSKATAKNAHRNIMEKQGCREFMSDLLEAHITGHNTPEMIAMNIAEFRNAKKRITIGNRIISVPDYNTRARGVELWLKSMMLGIEAHKIS